MTPREYRAKAIPKLSEATGHPLAAEILEQAHTHAHRVGRLLIAGADKAKVIALSDALCDAAERHCTPHDREFAGVLAGMLCEAIIGYTKYVVDGVEDTFESVPEA